MSGTVYTYRYDATETDKLWFAANPRRRFRLRPMEPGEAQMLPLSSGEIDGTHALVERMGKSGVIRRSACRLPDTAAEHCDHIARMLRDGQRFPRQAAIRARRAAITQERHMRFRALVRRLHQLGPRPLGEMLVEVARAHPAVAADLDRRLERYAMLDPGRVAALDADDWLPPATLIRAVDGGALALGWAGGRA